MDIVTIDFETYYDKDYSLSKMTTEAYIRDPRFQIIGVGIKVNDHEVDTYCGSDPIKFVKSLDYSKRAILCHNTAFDGAILSWLCGVKPKLWLDTLSMARPEFRTTVGGSLKALAQHFRLGAKGTEVVNALGKRREDFTEEELAAYMAYCANDVDLTYKLFHKLKVGFPPSEIRVIDQTIRMYTEPRIVLNKDRLRQHLSSVKETKQKLIDALGKVDGVDIKSILMSNAKFAAILNRLGVTPPTKISPRTGKETYAFAKTDKGMTDLLEHPDARVSALAAARMGVKSTIEETRTEALLAVADRGSLPILLNYYGAHTGRFSGGDGLNLQNLPARKGKAIRQALQAPDGEVILGCDLSQIEARMLAWVAGQEDLVESFAAGRDVYCEFASEVYGRQITPEDKTERFVGKTCLAEGTLVLCERGWVPIEQVTTSDRVWDGEEWVSHLGSHHTGLKETIELCGVSLTPDHLVLCGPTWKRADAVVQNDYLKSLLLARGRAKLPSQAISLVPKGVSKDLYLSATATESSTQVVELKSQDPYQKAVVSAPHLEHQERTTKPTSTHFQISTTDQDSLAGSQRRLTGATNLVTTATPTMVPVVLRLLKSGAKIAQLFLSTFRLWKGGITLRSKWTGLTTTKAMFKATFASLQKLKTLTTGEVSEKCKKKSNVYDILSAGPRHRYTVLSESGPIIVHNCILGLGYQCGAERFREMLRQANVEIDEHEAQRIVYTYRNKYPRIAALWNRMGQGLGSILHGGRETLHPIEFSSEGITLPNKLRIKYPALRAQTSKYEYLADARAYRMYKRGEEVAGNKWVNIYGGKVTENVIQALARIVITHHMTQVVDQCKNAKLLFQVHDEIVLMAPEAEAEAVKAEVMAIMSSPPAWAEGLPVACEAGYAKSYGDVER